MADAVSVKNIRRTYGRVVAVDGCDFELRQGEIHVLMGTNGCGKSTLCKVIAGAITADSGTFSYFGNPLRFSGPLDARKRGIATVYQELSLNPTQTVAENIFLGHEPTRSGLVDRARSVEETESLFERLGDLRGGIHASMLVGDLSIDQRQIVEIAKALVLQPKVILFDESTSSLDILQVRAFFALVRQLKADGCSIIFISHRMEEIFEIGDRVTVMRNGRNVQTLDLKVTDRHKLVDLMIGETKTRAMPTKKERKGASGSGRPVLEIKDLSTRKTGPLSLELHAGEILGLGGLHGQGQSEFILSILGAVETVSGTLVFQGKDVAALSLRARLKLGFGYVSGDRSRDGALSGRSIFENLILTLAQKDNTLLIRKSRLWSKMLPTMQRLKLRYAGEASEIGSLSGGNQQKVLAGRALVTAPAVLLLDDPTKGIDVAAKADLFGLISELRRDGMAVVLYSSEDSELLGNSDRIAVFNSGQITALLEGDRVNEFELYSAALRHVA